MAESNKYFATYADALAAVVAGTATLPLALTDRVIGAGAVTESFTVPSGAPYCRQLTVPLDKKGFAVTVGGGARTVVKSAPSALQVRLDRRSGLLTFHSSDAGGAAVVTLKPYATAWTRNLADQLQAHVVVLEGVVTITTTIHVDKAGSDSTGNGSVGRPYLTVGAAVAAIGTPSSTNRYVVDVGPGDFNEAVILKKSYVTIKGAGPDATVIRHDVAASASSGLYAGPLKIHTGAWGSSHSGDTALAGVVVRDLTLKNQPGSDDGDVYCALCIGDPTRALAVSAIETPGTDVIVENCNLRGYRDTLTICGRASVLVRNSDIRGGLDTVFPIGADLTLINTRVENTGSVANACLYLCGTETINIHGCLLLTDSSGSSGAISIRTDPRDTSGVTVNVSGTHVGTTGAHGTLRPLLLTVNNSTTSVINIGKGCTFTETGHRSAPSGGSITVNDVGAMPMTGTMGDRYTPGSLKLRYAGSGATGPQMLLESLTPLATRVPQLVTRAADLDGSTPSSVNPSYTPVAVTSSGWILGEWIAQTCQPNGVWATCARIRAVQSGTAGNGDNPGQWLFDTCPDGGSTLATRWTINADGTCVASGAITSAGLTSTGTVDLTGAVLSGGSPLVFEGATSNAHKTTFVITDPTATRTITFKDGTGTVAFTSDIPAAFDPASPGAIGGTTPAAVTGTTLTATAAIVSSSTMWRDYLASAAAGGFVFDPGGPDQWAPYPDGTYLSPSTSNVFLFLPVDFAPGTIINRIRIKYDGGHADSGVKVALVKRDESGTTTAFTVVGTEQTMHNNGVVVTIYNLGGTPQTMAANTSYAIRITSDIGSAVPKLYGYGIETTSRSY